MNSNKKIYAAVDLFAGVGGIRLGFEYAFNCHSDSNSGIETVFVCEQDSKARHTYKSNFDTPEDRLAWGSDIRDQDVKKHIPKFDICLAGFPCQAFSNAGHRQGFEDEKKRGTLFFDMAEICEKHKPDIIFCENVRGLFTFGKKQPSGYHEIYDVIRSKLEALGYDVRETILDSSKFGVPQHRERLYIVAFRRGLLEKAANNGIEFKFPTSNEWAAVSKQWAASRLEDIREQGPIPGHYYLSERFLATLRRHRKEHEKKRHGFGYVIREWDGISGTILCSSMGRERNLVVDPNHEDLLFSSTRSGPKNKEHIRQLTPTEFMRLQGFPSTFNIEGVPKTILYKQFGNSVTIPVIESIAREIRRVLEAANI